ncbi:hypothetical protein [Geoalkalibacter sp.]|uniref:hypothetical protein n=1 Tax=Geoalkalibacter sp. TaxID=3041440 RepID=UPI00272DFFC6|nr:hypothetical protein [Geoalkalibacter sp.]
MNFEVTLHDQGAEELHARRAELAGLCAQLADTQREVSALRVRIARFERRFFAEVGRLYVELDELRARLAEKSARQQPRDPQRQAAARRSRMRAETSAGDYAKHQRAPAPPGEKPLVATGLRKLYRGIAAQIHPDRARDEASRAYQTQLMAELNEAFALGERRRMEDILESWKKHAARRRQSALAAELARLEQALRRAAEQLAALRAQRRRLEFSDMFLLMRQVEEAAGEGRDLLAELAEELRARILACRAELG